MSTFITQDKVAEIFEVDPETVTRWVDAGVLRRVMTSKGPQYNELELYLLKKEGPTLKPAQVAELFRVNVQTVTRWAREGRLQCIKTEGGHRRYRSKEVDYLTLIAEGPYLTSAEIAAYLNVHYKTASDYARNKKLNAFKAPGGDWLFPKREIEAMLTSPPH